MSKHCLIPLLALTLLSCSGDPSPHPRQISERLLDETSDVFTRSTVARWSEAFQWTFDDEAAVQPWRHQGFDRAFRVEDGKWVLGASKFGAFVERSTSFHSNDVDRIEVFMSGTGRRPLILQWAGPGEDIDPQRTLEVRAEGSASRYTFEVGAHPHWQGEIARVRWLPRSLPRLEARIASIHGERREITPQLQQSASRRSYKVTLDHTSRSARRVLEGAPLTWSPTVDGPLQLEAALGLDEDAQRDTRFWIEGVDGAGATTTLFEQVVPAAPEPTAGRWHPVTLDLDQWSGRQLELRFHVSAATPEDGATGNTTATTYGFWGDLKLTRPLQGERPPNVVLVVIDTLRADHLSLYGYPRPTTPNLQRWAEEQAVTFRSVVAASSWTYPSHVSLFTGLDTLSHGQLHPRSMPQRFDLLAQHLQRAGYETMAITGGGYLDAHYGFARGFDRYHVVPGRMSGRGDLEDGLARAREWTAAAHRPYFLFLHTYEVHTPHRARQPFHRQLSGHDGDPEKLARLTTQALPTGTTAGAVRRKTYAWGNGQGGTESFVDGDLQQVIDAYDSAIAYTDHHLGQFLDELSARGEAQVVAITSDHGEALGEYDLADHAYLYDFNLKVPLLIALPGAAAAGRFVYDQVRQIDVAPTLLAALDLPSPAVDGASLLPFFAPRPATTRPAEDDVAWSATAYQGVSLRRANRLKYIYNPTIWQRQTAQEALFSIDRDPDEEINLAADHGSTEELQRLAIGRIMENFDGLLLRIDNPTSGGRQLTIEGPHWLGPQFFKSVDAPADSLHFDDHALAVEIPAEERFSLVVDQLTPRDALRVGLTDGAVSCTFEPGSAEALPAGHEVLQQTFDDGCREVLPQSVDAAESSQALRLTFLYRHSEASGHGVGEALPAALADQLRALGYLD